MPRQALRKLRDNERLHEQPERRFKTLMLSIAAAAQVALLIDHGANVSAGADRGHASATQKPALGPIPNEVLLESIQIPHGVLNQLLPG